MLLSLDGLVCALMLAAAATDIRAYRIPNWISIAVVALFALRLGLAPHAPWAELAVGGIALLVGYGLFAARLFGAGDAKLFAAIGLWVGPGQIFDLLTITALAGGLIAAGILICRKTVAGSAVPAGNSARIEEAALRSLGGKQVSTPMPYGVAIVAGGLWCVASQYFGS